MADQREFANHVVDLLEPFGAVEAKRMFGGFGLFHQGLMIALISDGNLYLKADMQSKSLYESEGLARFSYFKKQKEYFLTYYQAPEIFFEDCDECLHWATLAYDASLRAASKKNLKNRQPIAN
jgi:DNA transformation protein